jgi:Flp pilus assembly protein TadG
MSDIDRLRRSAPQGQTGNVVLELALVLPLFLLLLAGMMDFGTLFWKKQVLTNATREGARAAALAKLENNQLVRKWTPEEVRLVMQNYLDKYNLNITLAQGSNYICQYNLATSPYQLYVEVNSIPGKLIFLRNVQNLFGGAGGADTVMLKARTTMAADWNTPPG